MELWKSVKVKSIICSLKLHHFTLRNHKNILKFCFAEERTLKHILAIESLPVLEKLNLNGNQFGDEGCETLISQMDTSGIGHKLDSLDEDNEPDDDEEDEESL